MKLGSSRAMDTKRPRGSERSKPCHELQLTRRWQPPYPWPPEQAQPGVSKPCRTTARNRVYDGDCWPLCSWTIYSAYQVGQFLASCSSVRFSCSPCAAAARRSAAARSAEEANVVSPGATRRGRRWVLLDQPV